MRYPFGVFRSRKKATMIAMVLFVGCSRRGDAGVRKNLPGTWVVSGVYPSGGDFKSTITVAPNGSYTCQIITHGTSNSVRMFELEGKLLVKDGVLIDTMTKHSNTNATHLPVTYRGRILRADKRELVVNYGLDAGFQEATHETVMRKIK